MHISRYQQTMVPLCWTQRRRRIRTTSTSPHCSTSDVFPTYWVALLYGIHQNQTDHFLRHGETSGNVIIYNIFVLCRRMALTVYLSFCAIWITVFTVSTFSYEVMKFKRGNANGTENEGSIIVRLLDNVPWTAIMCRNVIVVVLFCRRYPKMVTLIHDLSSLMRIVDPSPEPLFRFIRLSRRVTLVSFVILIAQLILVQMYYFNANFDGLTRNWSFAPFPLKIVGWQVACCVTIFSLPNFLAAQVIVGTIIGLVAGAHSLVKQVNNSLEKLAVYRRQNIHELCTELCSTVSFDCQVQCPEKLQCEVLSILRLVYFRTVQFAHAVSSVFSETLLVVVAADFASAGGYVGLLIGDPGNPNPIMLYFVRVYHALSTVTSMTFYLILQYWPFIRLPEEAGQTYHQLQSLMIHRGRTSDKWERELMHFLLTTKDSHVGIVAGKVLHFSRHLSVTMITLLCSYGVLVYELMHRKGGGLVVNHPEAPISHSNITFYHNASKV